MTLPADFTYDIYRMLLDCLVGNDYETLTVREYVLRDRLPERFVILRHDVDRKPGNAVRMAALEADRGIESTYYVRTTDEVFRPDLLRRIDAHGHEVGFHYESMDRADGDPERALDVFQRNLEMVREVVPVETACMHGNPLTRYDNRDLWEHGSFERFDLVGEAYLSVDFEDVVYFSDTGRTWADGALKIKDHTMGEGQKLVTADTTQDLLDLFRERQVDRACLLSHPNRWAGTTVELVTERTKDTAINVVKHGLNKLS